MTVAAGAFFIALAIAAAAAACVVPDAALGRPRMRPGRSAPLELTAELRAIQGALSSGEPLAPALARAPWLARDLPSAASLDDALANAAHAADARAGRTLRALAFLSRERLPSRRAAAFVAELADRSAFEDGVAAEVRARTSGVRAQVRLVALLVPALVAYLYLTVPSLRDALGDPLVTLVLLPGAVLLEILGVWATLRVGRRPW
ncbi:MAG TPA: hypothetical protein VFM93_12860 [Candidatus Limnocylindria bacterium]|nr:hypothetical protein [Candidatus Limnocylindria bacterium]